MNAEAKPDDPFAAMMARRIKTITVEGWPPFELREAPMSEIEPIIFSEGEIPAQEIMFQLVGASIWIGDHRGSVDLLKRMGPSALKKLLEAVETEILDLYGFKVPAEEGEANGAAEGSEAKPPRRKKKG